MNEWTRERGKKERLNGQEVEERMNEWMNEWTRGRENRINEWTRGN